MRATTARRAALALAFCATSGALPVATASAQSPAKVSWKCAADAVTAQVLTNSVVNPVTAGTTDGTCRSATTGLPNTGEALGLAPGIVARSAYAVTEVAAVRPLEQQPRAAAGVEGLTIDLLPGLPLKVGAAQSSARASCQSGSPAFESASEVANITIGDTPIVLDGVLQPITDALSDAIGGLLEVRLNETVTQPGGGRSVRAARVTVLRDGGSLANVIVAQSTVDANGAVCDPNAPGNGVDGEVIPSDNDGLCPPGSVLVVDRKVCVIPVPGSQTPGNPIGDVTGTGSVVIGAPFESPSGGTVYTLPDARKRFKSRCLAGSGANYAIVGSNGRDRITGTNKRDRIIGRGGNDRLDAGRGDDCVDGNADRDTITGGQGNDKGYGGTGRDSLNGDTGSDRLYGDSGRDTLVQAFGTGILSGGSGNDVLNASVSGARTRVEGGSGTDTARVNRNELRLTRGVEKLRVIR